jgi:CheY-like chemotaxis protein
MGASSESTPRGLRALRDAPVSAARDEAIWATIGESGIRPGPSAPVRRYFLLIASDTDAPDLLRALASDRATVDVAASLSEGVVHAQRGGFDAIVATWALRDAWGLMIVDALLQAAPSTPLVLLAADGAPLDGVPKHVAVCNRSVAQQPADFVRAVEHAIQRREQRVEVERARLERHAAEGALRVVLESSRDACVVVDDRGRLLYFNRAALELSSGDVESLARASFNPELVGCTRADVVADRPVELRTCEVAWDGVPAWLTWVRPSVLGNDNLCPAPSVQRERLAALGELASGLGGELATAAEMIARGLEVPDATRRVRAIARGLLALGDVGTHEATEVHLGEIVARVAELLGPELVARFSIEIEPLPVVRATRAAVSRRVLSLLLQAIASVDGSPGARIRVRVRGDGPFAVLEVEDSGRVATRPYAFGDLDSAAPTLLGSDTPTLPVTPRVGAAMGDVVVRSLGARGTLREVRFPLGSAAPTRVTLPPPTVPSTPEARRLLVASRVLVIDDEPAVLRAYRRMIEPDYTVVTARSINEGLAVIASDPEIVAIFSDVNLPGESLATLFEALAVGAPRLLERLIVVSGMDPPDAIAAEIARHRVLFLHKPIAPSRVRDLVRTFAAEACSRRG